jgi:hypothetical protein
VLFSEARDSTVLFVPLDAVLQLESIVSVTMAPPAVLQKAAKANPPSLTQARVIDYFKAKRGRGRPKKKQHLPNEVATILESATTTTIQKPSSTVEKNNVSAKQKTAAKPPSRTDWADRGANEERLSSDFAFPQPMTIPVIWNGVYRKQRMCPQSMTRLPPPKPTLLEVSLQD